MTYKSTQFLDKLFEAVKVRMYAGSPVLMKTGMRSGKTPFALELARRLEVKHVRWMSPECKEEVAAARKVPSSFSIEMYQPKEHFESSLEEVLYVLKDPFHLPNSYETFLDMQSGIEPLVLAIGSRGPEYDSDDRWRLTPGYSFSTWDLNPELKRDSPSLREIEIADPWKFERDFMAF